MRFSARSLAFIPMACALLALAPGSALAVSSTFDTDLEGWEAVGAQLVGVGPLNFNYVTNTGDMVHMATGGNPGGYARLTDQIVDPASFASAPAPFLGDLTSFIGGTFSFDHRLFDTGTPNSGIAPYSLLIASGELEDLNVLVWTAPAPTGATDWVHFDITIDPSDLLLVENVPLSVLDASLPPGTGSITPFSLGLTGSMTFEEILANVTHLLVGFELVDNDGVQQQEHAGLDNVQLVALPEPATAALVALGLLGLVARRRA